MLKKITREYSCDNCGIEFNYVGTSFHYKEKHTTVWVDLPGKDTVEYDLCAACVGGIEKAHADNVFSKYLKSLFKKKAAK